MHPQLIIDLIGWLGAIALLLAYWAVSRGIVAGTSSRYQLVNAAGSVCLLLNSGYYRAFPSSFVNVVWIGIAVATMIRYRGRSKPTNEPVAVD